MVATDSGGTSPPTNGDAKAASHVTPPHTGELEGGIRAAGDAESLPMRLALARTRSALFNVTPSPTRLGRFELQREIGRGATATVHTAFDPRLQRVIALKVFSRGLDPATSTRVKREARMAATFNHPNIVTVLDVGESEGRVWVAMERVEGQTLREFLPPKGSDWSALAPVFLPIAAALQEVHRQGIVHRDVKPENILVDAAGRVKLTDFGVSTEGPVAASAGAGGTPAYMSPEQIKGAWVGPASDQFSFCVSLFEALEGVRPFAAPSSEARLDAIHRGPEGVLSNTSIPKPLRAVLARGLRPDPAERFDSMAEVAGALGDRRTRRLRPALGVGVAGLAVAALVGGAEAPEPCAAVDRSIRKSWEQQREDTEDAFAAGPESFVIEGGPLVLANIDRYVDDLAATRVAVCEARVGRRLRASTASGRVLCLTRRQSELERFIESMSSAAARRSAIAGSYALKRVESCLNATDTPPVAEAIRSDVEKLERELDTLREHQDEGLPQERIARAEVLVARAHALGHRPLSIRARTALGNARDTAGDAEGALEAWEDAYFSARQEDMPVQSFELATAIIGAFATLGRFDDAQSWIRHARAAKGRAPGPLTESRIDQTEATVLLMLERPKRALPLLEKALERRQAVLGEEHPIVAGTHLELGNAYLSLGDFERALSELGEARRLYEIALGSRHPNLATIDNNVGAVEFFLGHVEKAAEHWKHSLAIGVAAYGEKHISAHGTLTNLAKASATQEDWAQAEAFVVEALEIWEGVGMGDDHPELVGTLEVYGEVLLQRGEAERAYDAYAHAIEICDAVYGGVEAPTLGPLSGATRAAWELGDVAATAGHAERFLGSPSSELFSAPVRAEVVWLRAQALWELGRADEARREAGDALELYRGAGDENAVRSIEMWRADH